MQVLISCGDYVLAKVPGNLPFCWYENQGGHYRAEFRDDGLIYIAGFSTREKAEEWALNNDIMPEPDPEDEQGEL